MKVLVSVLLVSGLILSVRARRQQMMWRTPSIQGTLSKAITQLVGTAGGIYLSLELLFTFLGIPEEVWNPPSLYYFKPLAAFSLFIAILQPYGQLLLDRVRKRRG
ncbi:MAG: hypothetical protein GX351_04560 [Peptococcaceae bacterium]|jgi:hypothetical protein|nr:hypothetical protein [Peptococcaceae bacterium]